MAVIETIFESQIEERERIVDNDILYVKLYFSTFIFNLEHNGFDNTLKNEAELYNGGFDSVNQSEQNIFNSN